MKYANFAGFNFWNQKLFSGLVTHKKDKNHFENSVINYWTVNARVRLHPLQQDSGIEKGGISPLFGSKLQTDKQMDSQKVISRPLGLQIAKLSQE